MFTGFTPEAIDFLWGVRMNNNREWFLPHKEQYVHALYEPMKELAKDLFPLFEDRPGNQIKVSRIYRDARLHHPDPYKESLWLCVRKEVDWWGEHPCLYFEMRPEGASYGFFLWQPKVMAMEDFRRDIAARPDAFLDLIAQVEAATGVPVTADLYKRPKAPEDSRLSPYFAWRRYIDCTRSLEPGAELFDPQLGQRVRDFFEKALPLYEYFYRFTLGQ